MTKHGRPKTDLYTVGSWLAEQEICEVDYYGAPTCRRFVKSGD